jgi:uncharacterized protein
MFQAGIDMDIDSAEAEKLSCGALCIRNGCVACCLETYMPLIEEDIKRIEKLGFKRTEFTIYAEGETRIRNINGACFFLEKGRCQVYSNRPEGCSTYPLVYDMDFHKFTFDPDCPHSADFRATKEDKDKLKRLIRRIERESENRS